MQTLNNKTVGSTLTAAEWNEVPSELQNIITAFGITLTSGDLNQLGKGVKGYAVIGQTFDNATVSANVVTVISDPAFQPLVSLENLSTINFKANFDTTAIATLTVDGLGPFALKYADGTDGTLVNGNWYTCTFNGIAWEIISQSDAPHGFQLFTANGTFTLPDGVNSYDVTAVGAGGGGGGGDAFNSGTSYTWARGGGQGGGGGIVRARLNLASLAIVIGAGGAGGDGGSSITNASDGVVGGTTTVDGFAFMGAGGGFGGIRAGDSNDPVENQNTLPSNAGAGAGSGSSSGTAAIGGATEMVRGDYGQNGNYNFSILDYSVATGSGQLNGAGGAALFGSLLGGGGRGGSGQWNATTENISTAGAVGKNGYVLIQW